MAERYAAFCAEHHLEPKLPIEEYLDSLQDAKILDLYGSNHELYTSRMTDADIEALADALQDVHVDDLIIDLGCNRLTDRALPALAKLVTTKNVVGLSLRANQITPEGARTIIAQQDFLLHPCCRLKYLSLADNDLGAAGTEAVMSAILNSEPMHFGIVQMWGRAGELRRAIEAHGCLQYLDLSNCGFGEHANLYLTDFLRSRFCGLRELKLNAPDFVTQANHYETSDATLSGVHRLVSGIRRNTSLEALSLRSCRALDDHAACGLIAALVATVPDVDAEQANIVSPVGSRRTKALYRSADALLEAYGVQTVSTIDYTTNLPALLPAQTQIRAGAGAGTGAGVSAAAESFLRVAVTPLRFLDLSSNHLGFDVALELARHLRNPESYLSVIVLDGLLVRNTGANELAKSLLEYHIDDERVGDKQRIYFDSNRVSTIDQSLEWFGAERFRHALCLSLRRTRIGGQGLSTLALLTKHNRAIKYVAIEGNTLENEVGEAGTINESREWNPRVDWEATFMHRDEQRTMLECDFGLKRNEDGAIQYYKKDALSLKAIAVFK